MGLFDSFRRIDPAVEGSAEDSRNIDRQIYNNVLPHTADWHWSRPFYRDKINRMIGQPQPPPHLPIQGNALSHPTAWMETFMQKFGVDPNDLKAEQWTPQMRDFMRTQINRDGAVSNALRGGF
jgi:hypothetical protein